MKNGFHICVISLLLFSGCTKQEQENDAEDSNSKIGPPQSAQSGAFVAYPQPVPEQEITTLEPGQTAPDFRLPGVDGNYYSLADFSEADVLVIIFTCNHCPTAQAYEDRMIEVTNDYKGKGVQVVAISPNSPIGLLLNELGYSDLGDTYEEMILRAEYKGYNFPYLYDGDVHSVSMEYGPVATPHAFVFDRERKMRYTGRIDAIEKPGAGNAEDLRDAIDAVLAEEEVENPVTKTFGCSIKWAWKDEYKERVNNEWNAIPVTLENIDQAGIKDLLKNDSENLRLINIWATWCGPCIVEYPEFIEMQRMYGLRNFEFVSLSADKQSARDAALKFLENKHSGVTNYIFSEDDSYALIEAIDPEWDGALPYTMLIEPGGKVVYSIQGSIDPLEVKRKVVEHPLMGRYY